MEYVLKSKNFIDSSITITEDVSFIKITISHLENECDFVCDKTELHSFIGALLHVQSKMKGVKNV